MTALDPVDPVAREFSLRGYRALLTALLEAGYQPATFALLACV